MNQYHELLRLALDKGHFKEDRTGTGTYGVFGHQMRFDLEAGFPLVTTKQMPFRAVVSELLWFISGSTNCNDLRALLHGEEYRNDWSKKTIWDDNAANQGQALGYEDGELGPVYGAQWRSWPHTTWVEESGAFAKEWVQKDTAIDQLAQAVQTLKTNPDSRRIIVSAWNPAEVDKMALPPCHCLFQFFSRELRPDERVKWHQKHNGGQFIGATSNLDFLGKVLDKSGVPRRVLSCQLYQRSCDLFLGVPFNIASYALLTQMVAQVTDHALGEFVWTGGDCHVYANHVEQAKLQLSRTEFDLPRVSIDATVKDLFSFKMQDFELLDYVAHPSIAAPMAI